MFNQSIFLPPRDSSGDGSHKPYWSKDVGDGVAGREEPGTAAMLGSSVVVSMKGGGDGV